MPKLFPEILQSIVDASFQQSGHSHPRKAQAHRVAAAFKVILDEVIPEYREHHPHTRDEKLRSISAYLTREEFLQIIYGLENIDNWVKAEGVEND
jgi:hypothetical protein